MQLPAASRHACRHESKAQARTGRWGASTARSESVAERTMYTSAKVRMVSMPQPPAGVVGANSWLTAPPAAAYDTGLYCRPQQAHSGIKTWV